jgi:hypothetical protein
VDERARSHLEELLKVAHPAEIAGTIKSHSAEEDSVTTLEKPQSDFKSREQ